MASETLIIFNENEVPAVEGIAPSWTVIEGNPVVKTWRKYEDHKGDASELNRISGIWESTPGKFVVNYKIWEFCHFLEGECILTEEGHPPKVLRAGDAFVLTPGFKGEWEVVKTVRKHFVVQF